MKNTIAITLVYVLLGATSCASLWPFGSDKPDKPDKSDTPNTSEKTTPPVQAPTESTTAAVNSNAEASPVAATATPKPENDAALQQARILARMDSIEKELIHQRETVRLLEQGLLTGIPPEDLKKSAKQKQPQKSEVATKPETENLSLPKNEMPVHEDLSSRNGESSLNAKLQQAKEHYNASRFGLAIAELAGISREFGNDAADGSVRVWLGKSYLGLKEYGTAGGEFEAYLKGWPSGEHVARTRLDLARVYVGLGLKERARRELRRVIKDFEGNDESEMASLELKNIQGAL